MFVIVSFNFGQNINPSSRIILIGNNPCINPSLDSNNSSRLFCTTPAGVGIQNISIVIANQPAINSNDFSYIYDKPVISSVVISDLQPSTLGHTRITITGSNFGPSDPLINVNVIVLIGSFLCLNVNRISNSRILCDSPPGQGFGLNVIVNIAGQVIYTNILN